MIETLVVFLLWLVLFVLFFIYSRKVFRELLQSKSADGVAVLFALAMSIMAALQAKAILSFLGVILIIVIAFFIIAIIIRALWAMSRGES